jgi:hypothetical protein
MRQSDRAKLHFGPYRTPRFKLGTKVQCAVRGKVTITGVSKGRIPWPLCRPRTGFALVVCGDLEKAVRRESGAAVAHWWGVGWTTVRRWRHALGVGRYNAGTVELRKAGYNDAKRSKKISASKTGKPRPPLTTEWKEKIRASMKKYHRQNNPAEPLYCPSESDAQLCEHVRGSRIRPRGPKVPVPLEPQGDSYELRLFCPTVR